MSGILQTNDNICEGYLKLCDLKVRIIDCVNNNEKIIIDKYLKYENFSDYGLNALEILLKNLYLAYNECMFFDFSQVISCSLAETIDQLEKLCIEMKDILEEYPELDSEITLNEMLNNLSVLDLDFSNYQSLKKYLDMKEIADNIDLFEKYNYKIGLCYKKNVFCFKNK